MANYESALAGLTAEESDGSDPGGEWKKPDPETDKLFMSVGGNTIIEVGHPAPKKDDQDLR